MFCNFSGDVFNDIVFARYIKPLAVSRHNNIFVAFRGYGVQFMGRPIENYFIHMEKHIVFP